MFYLIQCFSHVRIIRKIVARKIELDGCFETQLMVQRKKQTNKKGRQRLKATCKSHRVSFVP